MSNAVDLSARSEQTRVENMQRRLLSAQLASQVLSGDRALPGQVDLLWKDLADTIDRFLKAAE